MKTKIITDSMSDLSPALAEAYDIEVIPINVSLDGEYQNEFDLDIVKTIEWIEENKKTPAFKGIGSEVFVKTFERFVSEGKEIVYISTGSQSISNYDSACHASTRFPNAKIHVIDTHFAGGNVATMAINAALMARAGESANAIAIRFERTADKYKLFGFAVSVDFLKYAGLCPRFVAVGVNLLNAKFEFEMLKDKKFEVQMIGSSTSRAMTNYFSNVFRDMNSIDPSVIVLMHTTSDKDTFTELYRRVEALNYFEDIVVCDASHYTTSLVGRDGMSVSYQLK